MVLVPYRTVPFTCLLYGTIIIFLEIVNNRMAILVCFTIGSTGTGTVPYGTHLKLQLNFFFNFLTVYYSTVQYLKSRYVSLYVWDDTRYDHHIKKIQKLKGGDPVKMGRITTAITTGQVEISPIS